MQATGINYTYTYIYYGKSHTRVHTSTFLLIFTQPKKSNPIDRITNMY